MTSFVQQQVPKDATSGGRSVPVRSQRKRAQPRESARTCIGCRQSDSRENLIRLVATPDASIAFDLSGGSFGRGAWVHPRAECLKKSAKGLSHAFRCPVVANPLQIHQCLITTAWRRAEALARAARRAGYLIIGADSGSKAWSSAKVALAIVADDARAAATVPWVRAAQEAGRTIVGPPKAMLGHWCGQDQVAVVAITDSGLAKAMARATAIAQMPIPTQCSLDAERGTEVG